MTYDARWAVLEEQKAWVKACRAALCYAYSDCCGNPNFSRGGGGLKELCAHAWCHGIVDVLNRAYCNEHVSYRIPEVSDAVHEQPAEMTRA